MPQDNRQQRNRGPRTPQQENSTVASGLAQIKFTKPLDPELFNTTAQAAARKVAECNREHNKPTQLRRFYDELILWSTRVSRQPDRFDEFLPFIRMLNAKAAYAEGRKLVDSRFVSLLGHTLSQVKDPNTLETCKLFWEAFMGFYKCERPN
jgi:CRISPR-associated protein Csm2